MLLAFPIYKPIQMNKFPRPAPPPARLLGKLEVSTALGSFLGDTRIKLLEAIAVHGSISRAAKHVPLSYKAAWDAVDAMNNIAELPLVERSAGGRQGGGTRLTDHGRRLVALFRAVELEYQAALDRLTAQMDGADGADGVSVRGFQQLLRRMALRTSARNQLAGTVSGLREGDVDYEVFLRLDERTELKAVITRESAQTLEITIGVQVLALIKSSAVLLMTDPNQRISADNQLWGTVAGIHDGPVNSEVKVDIGGARTMVAVVTHESVQQLGLAEGSAVAAVFQASSVILSVLG
jgi:molybdate transport system regulatory protein